jgi:hypothetical protein
MNMTPEERRATPPWKTLDVPEDELIVRMEGGKAMSTRQAAVKELEKRGALDMSQSARMQRAIEQGYDVDTKTYRGIYGEYDEGKAGNYQMFTRSSEDAGEYGNNVVPAYLKKGNNLVVDGDANNFNSIPVKNLPDPVRKNLHSSVGGFARTDEIAYAAQGAGYDSVTINNVYDKAGGEIPLRPITALDAPLDKDILDLLDEFEESGMGSGYKMPPKEVEIPKNYDTATIDIIFDGENIRSPSAAFDPKNIGKTDILGSADPRILPATGAGALVAEKLLREEED